jgi:ribosomal protein S18 acetylase RimI-like enzyme
MVTTASIGVRRAAPEDAPAIGEAHSEAWRVGYARLFDPDVLDAEVTTRRAGWEARMAAPGMEHTVLLVGELDGVVRGFAHVGPAADGSGRGEVYGFYAHPMTWGQGLAQAMMAEGLASLVAMGFDTACVWTLRDAGRARAFYEKVGFRPSGATKHETFGGQSMALVEYSRPTGVPTN